MEWTEDGFVLAARRHGEAAAVVQLFTRGQGRHAGSNLPGGQSLPGGSPRKPLASAEFPLAWRLHESGAMDSSSGGPAVEDGIDDERLSRQDQAGGPRSRPESDSN